MKKAKNEKGRREKLEARVFIRPDIHDVFILISTRKPNIRYVHHDAIAFRKRKKNIGTILTVYTQHPKIMR